jgi:putative flippase GtrA
MNGTLVPGSGLHLHGNTRRLATFGAIGVVSTVAYVVIYAWLRMSMAASAANAAALLVTAVGNTAANRRLTFAVQGRQGLARDHAAGILALGVALVITTASVAVMDLLAPHRGRPLEIAVLVAANASATVVRFVLLRLAFDRRRTPVSVARRAANLSPMETSNR